MTSPSPAFGWVAEEQQGFGYRVHPNSPCKSFGPEKAESSPMVSPGGPDLDIYLPSPSPEAIAPLLVNKQSSIKEDAALYEVSYDSSPCQSCCSYTDSEVLHKADQHHSSSSSSSSLLHTTNAQFPLDIQSPTQKMNAHPFIFGANGTTVLLPAFNLSKAVLLYRTDDYQEFQLKTEQSYSHPRHILEWAEDRRGHIILRSLQQSKATRLPKKCGHKLRYINPALHSGGMRRTMHKHIDNLVTDQFIMDELDIYKIIKVKDTPEETIWHLIRYEGEEEDDDTKG